MKIEYISANGQVSPLLKSIVEKVISKLIEKGVVISTSGSQGGYFSSWQQNYDNNSNTPRLRQLIRCGNFPAEKEPFYLYYSMEKAVRLNQNIKKGHRASHQSEDEEQKEYTGAVYFIEDGIFSFSGLIPVWDEFISVVGSCFHYYSTFLTTQRYPGYFTLEMIPDLFDRRASNTITATAEQFYTMKQVVAEIVADEIELVGKIR